MTGPDLTRLLERAADDGGRPLETDLGVLLDRARRSVVRRQRRRGALTLAAAAAVVTGVALLPSTFTNDPGPVAPVHPATKAPAPGLSQAEIVRRCRPQLAKYAAYPMYDRHPETAPWYLAHPDRRYRVGQLVQLVGGSGDPELCVIPRPEEVDSPVSFGRLSPQPGQDTLLRAVCAEGAPDVGVGDVRIPDLRHATLLASAYSGRVNAALLEGPDGHYYGCATQPPAWGPSTTVGLVPARGFFTTGGMVAPDVGYRVLVGQVPTSVRTVEVTVGHGRPQRFRIGAGHVAAVLTARATRLTDLLPVTYRLLATDRSVVRTGSVG